METADNLAHEFTGFELMFWRPNAKLTNLPDELLLNIFRIAANTGSLWRHDAVSPSREAYNLCLVCQSLLPAAKEILYTNVVVPYWDDLHSSIWTAFFSNGFAITKCKKLTLKCHPWRSLSYMEDDMLSSSDEEGSDSTYYESEDSQFGYQDPLEMILSQLVNLVCLDDQSQPYSGRYRDSYRERYLNHFEWHRYPGPQFDNITMLHYDVMREPEFEIMLSAFPKLKRVLVRDAMHIENAKVLEKIAGKGTVETLHISHLFGTDIGFKRLLAWPKALKHLCVLNAAKNEDDGFSDLYAFLAHLQPQGPSLEYAALPRFGTSWSLTGENMSAFKAAPKAIKSLTALDTMVLGNIRTQELLALEDFPMLSSNLKNIVVLSTPAEVKKIDFIFLMFFFVELASRERKHGDQHGSEMEQKFRTEVDCMDDEDICAVSELFTGLFRQVLRSFGLDFGILDRGLGYRLQQRYLVAQTTMR